MLGAGVEGAGVGSRVVGFGVSSMAGGTGDGVKQTLQKWAERATKIGISTDIKA